MNHWVVVCRSAAVLAGCFCCLLTHCGTTAAPVSGHAGSSCSGGGCAAASSSSSGTTPGPSSTATTGSTSSASDGGSSSASGDGAASGGGLPALTVNGNKLQDPAGKTIILRGTSLIDIGSLYSSGGQGAAGITARLDATATAGVQGHVVRMPVYPEVTYNGTTPTCSPLPYPVATGPAATCTPKPSLSASDYVANVLKPAVDYATSKALYVIIDFHQIDNATTGASAADATTFWTDIAPRFASYSNVLYEPFNEPIDSSKPWSTLKPVVQGLIATIRAGAPNNLIIVPSNSWDQHPGDAASDPPSGTNLMYTAHIYPSNWTTTFQNQVATALAVAPVFISEWGYTTASGGHSWGVNLQTLVDGDGASWTAWVTDNAWQPAMFTDKTLTTLNDFGTLVQSWLAAKANSDWVQ